MSENDVVFVERRLTTERTTRAFAMRKGEARIEASLSNAMRDARREIEQAFRFRTEGMGYVVSDPNRARGIGEMSDQAMRYQMMLQDRFKKWMDECHRPWRRAVISMIIFTGKTMQEIADLEGMHRSTLSEHYRRGLNEYCAQNGWISDFDRRWGQA